MRKWKRKQKRNRRGAVLACLSLVSLLGCTYAAQLEPFTTDGCSSFPDGPPEDPDRWRGCCVEHDLAYWVGGSRDQRRQADDALAVCVEQAENKVLADAMWAGVRAGGSPFWFTEYRWAYGWPYTRGYRELTPEEQVLAKDLLKQSPY